MTILPKKDKSENSDSDGSNSSTNSTNTTPRDAYQHTGSCHNEDYDSASQSKPGSVSRSKRRLRAAVSTRPLQTAQPHPDCWALGVHYRVVMYLSMVRKPHWIVVSSIRAVEYDWRFFELVHLYVTVEHLGECLHF